MALAAYFDALGEGGSYDSYFVGLTTSVMRHNATSIVLNYFGGAKIEVFGEGLTFHAGLITGGSVTGITETASSGAPLFSVTGTHRDAVHVMGQYGTAGVFGLVADFLAGHDTLNGSVRGDAMTARGGDDVLSGMAGDDFLIGNGGSDTLTGGAGADTFAFYFKNGTDHITDFGGTVALVEHDLIQMTRWLYHHMTTTQVGADVDIAYGQGNHVILENFTLADLDRQDFSLF